MKKGKQLQFEKKGFKKEKSDHGGSLKNPQKRKRPLGFDSSLHLVLRSTSAKNEWSFKKFNFEIDSILNKFAHRFHIKILSYANVGNHIHLHIKIQSRKHYRSFIRAICSAIMLKITGFSRWKKPPKGFQFWDKRPFSRIVCTWTEFLKLKKYILINQWEGVGIKRDLAKEWVNHGLLAPNSG